jgi:hypothetical protein
MSYKNKLCTCMFLTGEARLIIAEEATNKAISEWKASG